MICVLRCATALVMTCSVAACTLGPGSSYVDRIETPADAKVLAGDMADFVAGQLAAGSGAVILDPTPSDQDGNALTPALVAALRDRGFAVADARQVGAPGTHRITYLVTRLDRGDLVRLTIDGGVAEASRFFVRNTAGDLQAGGPFTVRQMAQAN
jgi:type IV secretion system protein TrbH